MILKNKTQMYQTINTKNGIISANPFRTVEVDDATSFEPEIWEVVKKTKGTSEMEKILEKDKDKRSNK